MYEYVVAIAISCRKTVHIIMTEYNNKIYTGSLETTISTFLNTQVTQTIS